MDIIDIFISITLIVIGTGLLAQALFSEWYRWICGIRTEWLTENKIYIGAGMPVLLIGVLMLTGIV